MDSQTIGAAQRTVCRTENVKGYIRRVICGSSTPTLSHCGYLSDDNCDEDCGQQKQYSALRCSTGTQRILRIKKPMLIKG